jgi:hypothetical protein
MSHHSTPPARCHGRASTVPFDKVISYPPGRVHVDELSPPGEQRTDSFTRPFYASCDLANMREHAAGPPDYWGSRGREFKSRRPDRCFRR